MAMASPTDFIWVDSSALAPGNFSKAKRGICMQQVSGAQPLAEPSGADICLTEMLHARQPDMVNRLRTFVTT